MRILFQIVICFLLCTPTQSQSAHSHLRNGDMFYGMEVYDLSEQEYRKATDLSSAFKGAYNLGNTLYKQERFEEAAEQYNKALSRAENTLEKSLAAYNLANAYVFNQKFEDAILYYKKAIKEDPNNIEAKYNLTAVKTALSQAQQQEQQQQQQQNQENQENQEQTPQDSTQQQQQNQEQTQQDSTQQNQEAQDSLSEDQNIEESGLDSSRLDKSALDSLDAVKLLEVIESEEQKVQENLKKFNSNRKRSDKEW